MSALGFMGEPFPSKKFQRVMAEYIEHGEDEACCPLCPLNIENSMHKPSYDELYQEVLTLRAELERLRNQIQS